MTQSLNIIKWELAVKWRHHHYLLSKNSGYRLKQDDNTE